MYVDVDILTFLRGEGVTQSPGAEVHFMENVFGDFEFPNFDEAHQPGRSPWKVTPWVTQGHDPDRFHPVPDIIYF